MKITAILGSFNGSLISDGIILTSPNYIFMLLNADERSQVLVASARLGADMVRAIETRSVFPAQQQEIDRFFEIWEALITMNRELFTFEYEYWKSHWGLEE